MRCTPAQLAAYVGKSERTIHRWLASGKLPYKRLTGGLIEVDDALLTSPDETQESAILAALHRIEEKIDALAANVDTLSAHPAPRYRVHTEHAEYNVRTSQGELPDGLMPWRDYAREKGYPETTVKRAIDRGEIPVHEGKWKRGGVYILAAIDEEGKAAMDRLYGH